MPPAALLFDLDGTLVHSVPDLRAALNVLLSEDGRRPLSDDAVAFMVGNGVRKLVERGYRATGAALSGAALDAGVARFMAVYGAAPAALSHLFPGVAETLEHLRGAGHVMAVCTNKPVGPARALLAAMGLDGVFGAVVGGGSTPYLKPHPAPLRAALNAIGARPEEAVFVGDSLNDTEAARAAGLPVICVTFGYRRCAVEELAADALIDAFTDLPAALAGLRGGPSSPGTLRC
jgi:phosphoglycolate phosphatase